MPSPFKLNRMYLKMNEQGEGDGKEECWWMEEREQKRSDKMMWTGDYTLILAARNMFLASSAILEPFLSPLLGL
jgi:hypothetical protein